MKIGIVVEGQMGLSYTQQLAIARRAESLGFDAFYRTDHYESFPGPADQPTSDAWSVLAGLARETATIALGTLVSPVTFRAPGEYAKVRAERRRTITEYKKNRRLEVGPYAAFYFESYETMLHQVHEMLFIEKGGAAQIPDELAAYNPLIPQGSELVATVMFEIDDPVRRARVLGSLGGVEHKAFMRVGGETIRSVAEDDQERTREDGKASGEQGHGGKHHLARAQAHPRPHGGQRLAAIVAERDLADAALPAEELGLEPIAGSLRHGVAISSFTGWSAIGQYWSKLDSLHKGTVSEEES